MTGRGGEVSAWDTADEVAILGLYENYNRFIDRGEAESWASTWSQNGVFEHPSRTYEGHDELAAFVRHRAAALRELSVTDHQHWNSGIQLTTCGSHVSGVCRLLVSAHDRESGAMLVATTGSYSDVVVRVGSEWKFARRSLTVD